MIVKIRLQRCLLKCSYDYIDFIILMSLYSEKILKIIDNLFLNIYIIAITIFVFIIFIVTVIGIAFYLNYYSRYLNI